MDNILASAIANVQHLAVFDRLAAARMNAIQLEALLVYVIDTVPAEALPVLAAQFDVLGYKGWKLAKNDAERRELIKRAIELHRYKGTPWAVKEAIKSVGYFDAKIIEHAADFYNAVYKYDAEIDHGGTNWARFSVLIDLGENKGIDATTLAILTELINEYKNVRSWLTFINFTATLNDSVSAVDELSATTLQTAETSENVFSNIFYNNVNTYDGTQKYGNIGDILELVITLVTNDASYIANIYRYRVIDDGGEVLTGADDTINYIITAIEALTTT